MASSSGDEEWVYVDEDSKAAPVDASPVDSSGDKEDDNVAAVEGATESAAAGDGELPGGATASEVDADDVTASEKEDDDTSAVGSDDDVSSYGATEVDKYLEYEDDIADGLDGLEIDGAATPPISLNNDDLPPIDAAEEAPAYATKDEDEHPRYDDVPVPYGYLYPAGRYRCVYGGGAYYGGQHQYLASYYPSYYLPPSVPYAYTYPYAYGYNPYDYAPYAGEPSTPPPPPPKN